MAVLVVIVAVGVLALIALLLSLRIVKQYEQGVVFRLGRVVGVRQPGLNRIVPVIDVIRRVSLRIVTMPIESQGIITRDNVSVDVSAVAYFRVVDAMKSLVAIENVAGYEPNQPLRLEANVPSPGRPRNPNHARRPHPQGPKKPHAAGNKQHRPWQNTRGDQRKA